MENISKCKPKIVKYRLILHKSNIVPTKKKQKKTTKNVAIKIIHLIFPCMEFRFWVIIGGFPIHFNGN